MTFATFPGETAWQLHATHGVAIEDVLLGLAARGYQPTWFDLFAAASADGANLPRLRRRLAFAIREAYPRHYSDVVCGRLAGLALQ